MSRILCFLLITIVFPIQAQKRNTEEQHFVSRIVESAKERARQTKDILIIVENARQCLLVFSKGKFEGVKCQISRKKVGMSISGMEFILIDKKYLRVVKYKKPYRYHSFYADDNYIKIRKEKSYLERSIVVKTTTEFFELFYTGEGKNQKAKISLDVQIYRPGISIETGNTHSFVEKLIASSKERAKERKDVMVIVENKQYCLIIFTGGNFKGVAYRKSRKKLGMNIKGMEYLLINKKQNILINYKKPYLYNSFYATVNSIKLKKENFYLSNSVIIRNSSEFFPLFYGSSSRGLNSRSLLDLQIFDARK